MVNDDLNKDSNIISFSLWGNNDKYCKGAIYNAVLANELYKNWICRFYINIDDTPDIIISTLKEMNNVEIVYKSTTRTIFNDDINPMIWRFNELFTLNQRFIVRDTDSRLSIREKKRVDSWILSKKTLHIIRDHPCHQWNYILGGLWGLSKTDLDKDFINIFKELYNKYKIIKKENCYQEDQKMLDEILRLYKDINGDEIPTIVHDEFKQKFLSDRLNYEFMGSPFDKNNNQEKDSIEILKSIK